MPVICKNMVRMREYVYQETHYICKINPLSGPAPGTGATSPGQERAPPAPAGRP